MYIWLSSVIDIVGELRQELLCHVVVRGPGLCSLYAGYVSSRWRTNYRKKKKNKYIYIYIYVYMYIVYTHVYIYILYTNVCMYTDMYTPIIMHM